jgi:hypothetical protein
VPPNWQAMGWMLATGIAAAVVGCAAFVRRDLQDA